jgi:DNA-directed RNA polymerase specialized sigma24 family protein
MKTQQQRWPLADDIFRQPFSDDLFQLVYDPLFNTLKRYWMSRGFSSQEAEDLAQEGCIKVFLNWDKIIQTWKGDCSLSTFFIVIGVNRGKELVRKDRRRGKIMASVTEIARRYFKVAQRRLPLCQSGEVRDAEH